MKILKKLRWVLVFFVIGVVISILCADDLGMGIILTTLSTLLSIVVEWYIKYQNDHELYSNEIAKIEYKIQELNNSISCCNQLSNMTHPYFKKRIDEQFKQFISSNKMLFDGVNITNPHADDTFGIEGISYTKEYGSIKAVSSIPDYWKDDFAKQYLKQQVFLIEQKHVSIQRIFILKKSEYKKQEKYMREQMKCGIQVFYMNIPVR